jgi:hypothetical protein
MPTSETPLSDLIDLVDGRDQRRYGQFVEAFRRSEVGVKATGAPPGTAGDFKSSQEHPIGVRSSIDPEGRSVLLAFADPPAFAQRFGMQFNAGMRGEALLETVLANPDCHGILVNSAKREISILIHRDVVVRLKRGTAEPASAPRTPWWKFW